MILLSTAHNWLSAIMDVGFMAVGAAVLFLAIAMQRRRLLLVKNGIQTTGIVIRLEAIQDTDGVTYYPVIRFRLSDQRVVDTQHSEGNNPPPFRVGQQIDLIYQPTEPENFIIGLGKLDWNALLFGVVGIAVIVFGICLAVGE